MFLLFLVIKNFGYQMVLSFEFFFFALNFRVKYNKSKAIVLMVNICSCLNWPAATDDVIDFDTKICP